MAFSRRHHNATLLPDGTVLVTGGTSGGGFNDLTHPVMKAELWDPATGQWTTLAEGKDAIHHVVVARDRFYMRTNEDAPRFHVVAIDPLANKREAAEQLGATHSCETAEQAQELITQLTRGVGADKAIVTVGVVTSDVVTNAFNAIRKGGTVVVTGLADPAKTTIELSGAILTLFEKRIQGSLFGSGDPFHDIPRMVELYQSGDLKLDELITSTYTLDQVNQGYQDLIDGKNIRGVIVYDS